MINLCILFFCYTFLVDYQFWTSGSISTEHVDLTHDTSDVFLPAGIPAGHILEIQKTFRMPIGYADIYFFSCEYLLTEILFIITVTHNLLTK